MGELRGLASRPKRRMAAASPGAEAGSAPSSFENPSTTAAEYTRGVGIYPGDPREDFGPRLVPDTSSTYRNLALHRPAYHSSSYDYNLTAQLVTDGIKDTHPPEWVATSLSFRGLLPKTDREYFLDHNAVTVVDLRGPRPWLQVQLGGGESAPVIDRVDVLFMAPGELKPENVSVSVSVSERWTRMEGSGQGHKPSAGYSHRRPDGF